MGRTGVLLEVAVVIRVIPGRRGSRGCSVACQNTLVGLIAFQGIFGGVAGAKKVPTSPASEFFALPQSPFDLLRPDQRWRPQPAQLTVDQAPKVLPPLVEETRRKGYEWRKAGYPGASPTTRTLIEYWFETEHYDRESDTLFQFYFAQRESFETLAYLYEVAGVRDKYTMLHLNAEGVVSPDMFDEDWTRYVIKMATGSTSATIGNQVWKRASWASA